MFGKWKKRKVKSSLTAGLLHSVPLEIELSDYHRLPSPPGRASPSLGESNAEKIGDLDLFFERVYNYYCEKGLWCIIIKWIFEILSLAFTVCFSGFFLLFVDWNGLGNAKCGITVCDLVKEAIHRHPLVPFTLTKAIIVGYLVIFGVFWIFCFLSFFVQLKQTLKIRRFYHNSLHIPDPELRTLPWDLVLEKVVRTQKYRQFCPGKDLSVHDVVMRLMRKENYLIGMLNKGVLAFEVPSWIPGAGPEIKFGPKSNGVRYRLLLTNALEWILKRCILQNMFDRNSCIRSELVSDPKTLRKTLRILGLAMLLLSPFLMVFVLVYLFLKHAEQLYNHPSKASSRSWSNLSKWMFRELNEVDHFFKHRINNKSALARASEYLKQFPSPKMSIVAKFISFITGGFAAILIIIAFLEESPQEGHILGRNLIWYAAVFGTITAISRGAVPDELFVPDPQGKMSQVIHHSHYMPKRWREKENAYAVKKDYASLFQCTGMLLLEDISSIFVTPFLLLFVIPNRVDDILQFIADFTADVEGVGHVCSFSAFDFQNHGNSRYGSPFNSSELQRSSQGKMEKSFLSFRSSYPSWKPNDHGEAFLSNVAKFVEQKQQIQAIEPRAANINSNMCYSNHASSDGNVYFFRRIPFIYLGTRYHNQFSSMELDHPYILDWYYTSQNRQSDVKISPRRPAEEGAKDLLKPSPTARNAATTNDENWRQHEPPYYDDTWNQLFDDRARSQLHVSTSATLVQESLLDNDGFNNVRNHTPSRWWARQIPRGVNPKGSFLEPTSFNYYHHNRHADTSVAGEQYVDFRNPSSSSATCINDDDHPGGQFNLPFGFIHTR